MTSMLRRYEDFGFTSKGCSASASPSAISIEFFCEKLMTWLPVELFCEKVTRIPFSDSLWCWCCCNSRWELVWWWRKFCWEVGDGAVLAALLIRGELRFVWTALSSSSSECRSWQIIFKINFRFLNKF